MDRLRTSLLIALFAALAVFLSVCGENDVATNGNDNPPAPPGEGAGAAPWQTPEIQPVADPSDGDGGMVEAPGSENAELFAPLADSYERIDPAKDGWETEAFSEAANRQLKRVVALFESGGQGSVADLADPEFSTGLLRPKEQSTVFEDQSLTVTRAVGGPAPSIGYAGPKGLKGALADYGVALGEGASNRRLKLKLYKVKGKDYETEVLVQATADVPGGRVQFDANWVCGWNTANSSNPLLRSIKTTRHSEARYSGEAGSLFRECTEAVLGGNLSYREQLLHSTDYWRLRIQRDLGLDVVANHGLAVGDVNEDGLDDLYLCQQGGLPNRLYIQQPDGTLVDYTVESGTGWLDYCASALIIDLDNDGDSDLVVGQETRLLLMENDGEGRFELAFGTSTLAQTFSIAAADYDADGDLDLFACGYNPLSDSIRRGAMGEPLPYHDARNGGANMLLRNDGGWYFNDATAEAGLDHNNNRFAFAASFEDYDNDGDLDLYVANDYGRNNLYRQDDGKFSDVAKLLGVEDMSSGMSVSWADFNHDGWMDVYVGNMFSAAGNRITYQRQFQGEMPEEARKILRRHARGNSLFQADGKAGFIDVSMQAGVTMGRWAWASKFADFNNDGWEDLVVANGFISTTDTGDL